jgi:putative tricarboxylic transport membrane protein
MSVRLERWSHGAAPSFGQPGLDAPKLHAWSFMARLRAFRLQRAVSERHGGMFVAAMLAATGGFFVWQAAQLDLGNIDLPGPGFFPLCLGTIIVVLSAIIGIGHWRSSEGEAVELGQRDVVVVIMALLVVPLVFESLGAYITLGLFGTTLLVLIARLPPLLAVMATGVGLAACWYFFQVLLGLQLPTGPL